jgi:hypothetical protein
MVMLKERIKLTWFSPSLVEDLKLWHFGSKEFNSSASNSVFIWCWVNRYVVLLRGMHHVDRWLLISAQANPCEIWVRESQVLTRCAAGPNIGRILYWPGHNIFSGFLGFIRWEFRQTSRVPGVRSSDNHQEFRRLTCAADLVTIGAVQAIPDMIPDMSDIPRRLVNC